MSLKRKIILTICGSSFRFLLFATATSSALVIVFGNSHHIKKALSDNKAYERFVPAIIEDNIHNRTDDPLLKDPVIQTIAKNSFPPADLRKKTELIIDSMYRWLNGASATPDFVVDFQPNVAAMASNVSSYTIDKLEFKPICGVQPQTIDPLTATCRPENFNYTEAKVDLTKEIQTKSFLPKTILTAENLPKDTAGRPIHRQIPNAPLWFQLAKQAPIILSSLMLICALVMFLMMRKKRLVIQQLGMDILGNGLFLCLSPLIFSYILPRLTGGTGLQFGGSDVQKIMEEVMSQLNTELNTLFINMGIYIAGAGVIIIFAERTLQPSSKYAGISRKVGLISGIMPRTPNGRFHLKVEAVPVQTSEGKRGPYRKTNKKYRRIPKKEI